MRRCLRKLITTGRKEAERNSRIDITFAEVDELIRISDPKLAPEQLGGGIFKKLLNSIAINAYYAGLAAGMREEKKRHKPETTETTK